jgi:hypothetical protein
VALLSVVVVITEAAAGIAVMLDAAIIITITIVIDSVKIVPAPATRWKLLFSETLISLSLFFGFAILGICGH